MEDNTERELISRFMIVGKKIKVIHSYLEMTEICTHTQTDTHICQFIRCTELKPSLS